MGYYKKTREPGGRRPAAPLAVVDNWVRLPAGSPAFVADAFEPHRPFDNGGLTLTGKGAHLQCAVPSGTCGIIPRTLRHQTLKNSSL